MNKLIKKPRSYIIIALLVVLLLRYVVFAPQINRAILVHQGMIQRKEEYKSLHPQATSLEVEQAFGKSLERLDNRQTQYTQDHPNATPEEINKAFEVWSGSKIM